jgi:hypothetical protein
MILLRVPPPTSPPAPDEFGFPGGFPLGPVIIVVIILVATFFAIRFLDR